MDPFASDLRAETYVSVAVFAWNEEEAIASTLRSLLSQSLLQRLSERGQKVEIYCILNGCTDRTAQVVEGVFSEHLTLSSVKVDTRVVSIHEKGKLNAWNEFVHSISSKSAEYLFLMDADIVVHLSDTLWNMLKALESSTEANISVDRPIKDVAFKGQKTLKERL